MISAEKALKIVLNCCRPARKESVRLREAVGRTAAGNIVAREDIPPFRNSSMDGYAVRSADLKNASGSQPVRLSLRGESSAGNPFKGEFRSGHAVRIMTGGKLPSGTDAVVPVEIASADGEDAVKFDRPVRPGDFVRKKGEDVPRGRRVIASGDLLTPSHLAILASTGHPEVRVGRRPEVGILATGDELLPPEETPSAGRIRNSSSYALIGLVKESGGKARFLGIVRDRKKSIRKKVREGLSHDILLLTGGVSVGAHDYVREVLESCGVEILFWRVNIRPGGPLLFGRSGRTLVFGLPGNPVSTGVTFLQFVRPAIRKMLGRRLLFPSRWTAATVEPLGVKEGKRTYLRGIVTQEEGLLKVRTTGSQSSGVMSSLLKANCLIILPEGTTNVPAGSSVTIEFLRDPL
ncbi:MAG TPA: gephyrin-like molybdotransferase Glp [Bacteroidota bacterium]|nr:gephyrin-like molybdotransferase Glp [Bacteroidota bacterium]